MNDWELYQAEGSPEREECEGCDYDIRNEVKRRAATEQRRVLEDGAEDEPND